MRSFSLIRWIVWKDLLCEIRNRENVASMLFFAVNVILVFSFSFVMDDLREVMPGLIWTAFGFTGVIGLGRSFVVETQNDCIESYQLLPAHKGVIYLGKLIGNVLFLLGVELALCPLFVLFFNLDVAGGFPMLLLVGLLGTIGLASLGTLFSVLTSQTRSREVLFPLLLLPLSVPVFIGAIEATRGILDGSPIALYRRWIDLLAVFDLIFIVVSFWLFEAILDD
jgi:heme exporter protein B